MDTSTSTDTLVYTTGTPDVLAPTKDENTSDEPTILIVHASVGSGHRSAANAIAQAFELLNKEVEQQEVLCERNLLLTDDSLDSSLAASQKTELNPSSETNALTTLCSTLPHKPYTTEVLDILDFGRVRFDGDKTASMFTGATRPYYDLTWRYTLTGRLLWGGGTIWARIMFPRFVEMVRTLKPAAIVTTHITAANVAVSARMIIGYDYPVVCVPTDYEVEGMWPHLYADLFCVADEYMAETLRPRKVPEDRILITGIPTRPDFAKHYGRDEVRKQFCLPTDKQLVLALAGAKLPRPYIHFRKAIDELIPFLHTFPNMHLAIVAGDDAEYADQLRRLVKEYGITNVTIFNYVEQMAALMGASDLVICKSGGLTVTECLCAGVPMILLGRAYGQEKANVRMLTAAGAALHATTTRELIQTLHHAIDNPNSTHAMLINAAFLRKPNAALDVAQATIELIEHNQQTHPAPRKKHFAHFYWGRKPAHTR